MRRLLVLLLAGIAILLLSAPAWAGGGGHGIGLAPCDGFSEGPHVAMRDNCFDGAAHLVQPGAGFTVRNVGGLAHTYTALDGTFDTGPLAVGARTQLAVSEPGIYKVVCTLHASDDGSGMTGVLVVGDPFNETADETVAVVPGQGTAALQPLLVGAGVALAVGFAIIATLRNRRRNPETAPAG